MKDNDQRIPLVKWIWKSFLRIALIPLIVVEIAFVGIYFLSNEWSKDMMVSMLKEEAEEDVTHIVNRETEVIQKQVTSLANTTALYQKQVKNALTNSSELSKEDQRRLKHSKDGVYYTTSDLPNGGAAVYYSAITKKEDQDLGKVTKLLDTQPLMKSIYETNPLVSAVYFNTYDSLNVIYPYIPIMDQFTPKMNIPSYNFYYQANEANNPDRKVVWTDAYLDPAGNGWIASSIAPVYSKDKLEGVVGIDMTVSTITDHILDMKLPWDGFGMLVSGDGTILALPEQGEDLFELTELKNHTYKEAIYEDTYKPAQFNLYKRNEFKDIAELLSVENKGLSTIQVDDSEQLIAWSTIEGSEWKFILVIDKQTILSNLFQLNDKLIQIGALMIVGLIFFYFIFFFILYKNARIMGRKISAPLHNLNDMIRDIGKGNYYQPNHSYEISELDETANQVTKMGANLGAATDALYNAQNEVKKKESDLRALVSAIDDVIMRVDENGKYINIWTNDESKLSKPMSELLGSKIDEVFPEEDAKFFMAAIGRLMKKNESETIEYSINTLSGRRWFQGRLAPILNEEGTNKHFVLTARDITDLKELEESLRRAKEEAERASEAKSDFLSSMSHELRTPMNAILGFAQLLDIDDLTESQHENVEEILKAGNHLLTLINEILDLARIESGKLSISIEPVQIQPVMEEAYRIILPLAEKRDITITHNLQESQHLFVYADRTRLKQVLLNLLSNAVKYNQLGGQIYLECLNKEDKVQFFVKDTGHGINEEEIDNIFEPFIRVENDEVVEGTGIGLTLSKRLIAMMDGSISVKSEVGKGSTFWFELPLVHESLKYEPEETEPTTASKVTSKQMNKILYIEDNPANLHLIQKIIENYEDIELITANNGEIGVDLAQAHSPNLILVDLNLPGIDGYTVLNYLQQDEDTNAIPVVAISANAMPKDIEKGLKAGFEDYLTKPIKVTEFNKMIQRNLYSEDQERES